jgi:2-oxoglutarate ferredoxin oxidoreductase subunit alpha
VDDAEVIVVAFGTAARVAQTAVQKLRRQGLAAGLFRPITLWPFPEERLAQLSEQKSTRRFLVVEMNAGQMLHDVRAAVGRSFPVHFYGRMGGVVPLPGEIERELLALFAEGSTSQAHPILEGRNGNR